MPVKIVAILTIKPGSEAAIEKAAAQVVAGSRAEPGCLRYDLWREPGGRRRYLIDELYIDDAAIDAHRLTDHYKAFRTILTDLQEAPSEVSVVQTIDVAT